MFSPVAGLRLSIGISEGLNARALQALSVQDHLAGTEYFENANLYFFARDTAVAHFANVVATLDLVCSVGTSPCSSPPSCGECNGPGGFAMMKSLSTLHNTLQNVFDAISEAGQRATNQMNQFSRIFGKWSLYS